MRSEEEETEEEEPEDMRDKSWEAMEEASG
jgi:hypothetical protein